MMGKRKRNARGFLVFDEFDGETHGSVKIAESSAAFTGAHVWIFQHPAIGEVQGVHLSVAGARRVMTALEEWLEAVEAGELMESESDGAP